MRSRSNWNLKVLVFKEREKPEYPEKNLSEQGSQNQQQTQPTYDVDAGIRTRATLVGEECSHQCATLALCCVKQENENTVNHINQ